jgi:uncharacterized membrane protein
MRIVVVVGYTLLLFALITSFLGISYLGPKVPEFFTRKYTIPEILFVVGFLSSFPLLGIVMYESTDIDMRKHGIICLIGVVISYLIFLLAIFG